MFTSLTIHMKYIDVTVRVFLETWYLWKINKSTGSKRYNFHITVLFIASYILALRESRRIYRILMEYNLWLFHIKNTRWYLLSFDNTIGIPNSMINFNEMPTYSTLSISNGIPTILGTSKRGSLSHLINHKKKNLISDSSVIYKVIHKSTMIIASCPRCFDITWDRNPAFT